MLKSDIIKKAVTIKGEKGILMMELDELLYILRKENFLTQGEILEIVNNSLKSDKQVEDETNKMTEKEKQEARKKIEKYIKKAKRRNLFNKNDKTADIKVHEINIQELDEEGQKLVRRLIDKFKEI